LAVHAGQHIHREGAKYPKKRQGDYFGCGYADAYPKPKILAYWQESFVSWWLKR
jgi:hypothetical protein